MNHYILPLPLLIGKPEKLSIQAVHRIWHLIAGGIAKLDYQSDAQLQKVFTDLVVKWIPPFRLVILMLSECPKTSVLISICNFSCQSKKVYQSHL